MRRVLKVFKSMRSLNNNNHLNAASSYGYHHNSQDTSATAAHITTMASYNVGLPSLNVLTPED